MDKFPTETRPGREVSWRRVLVALTFTFVLLGLAAGFFVFASGSDMPVLRRLAAATALVFRGAPPPSDDGVFIALAPETEETENSAEHVQSSGEPAAAPQPRPAPKTPVACEFSGKGKSAAAVRFSEIAWMGTPANTDGEWMELENTGRGDVALSGWSMMTASKSVSVRFGAQSAIVSGAFFVLERETDDALPGRLADHIFKGRFLNKGELVRLFDADCRLVDEVDAASGWKQIGGDMTTKRTAEFDPSIGKWRSSLEPGGTPGTRAAPEIPASSTPQAASDGAVFISEVFAGKEGAASYEFVELKNAGDAAVDLSAWSLKKRASTGSESTLVTSARLEGVVLAPGKHLLLANEGGYAGAVAPDVRWPKSYTLAAKTNGVVLYRGGEKIDSVVWAEIPVGKSVLRDAPEDAGKMGEPDPQNSGH